MGRGGRRRGGAMRALPQPRQQRIVELEPRQLRHVARHFAESLDAAAALRRRLALGARHLHPRHVEEKPRIDAIVARLDAFARQHAAARPFARRLVAGAVAQNVDDAGDDLDGILPLLGGQPGGCGDRADLDAFAAAGAGVGHGVGARHQGGFECLGHDVHAGIHRCRRGTVPPTRPRLKGGPSRCKTARSLDTRPSRRVSS